MTEAVLTGSSGRRRSCCAGLQVVRIKRAASVMCGGDGLQLQVELRVLVQNRLLAGEDGSRACDRRAMQRNVRSGRKPCRQSIAG